MKITTSLLVLLLGAPVFAVPLSVSVVDAQGAPVAGADVQFESLAKSPRGVLVVQSGADGRATFEVEPSLSHPDFAGRVFVLKNGFGIGDGQLTFKTPLRITLGAAAKISGQVVDSEGKPIENATISFLCAQKNGGRYSDMLIDGPFLARMTARSGKDGTWQLGDVPAESSVMVRVSAGEHVGTRTEIRAQSSGKTVLLPGAQIKGRLLGLAESRSRALMFRPNLSTRWSVRAATPKPAPMAPL